MGNAYEIKGRGPRERELSETHALSATEKSIRTLLGDEQKKAKKKRAGGGNGKAPEDRTVSFICFSCANKAPYGCELFQARTAQRELMSMMSGIPGLSV